MDTLKKSLNYFRNAIVSFGIIDGCIYVFHFYRSHFCGQNDGTSKKVVSIKYYPNGLMGKFKDGLYRRIFYRPDTSDVPLIANILIGIKEYDIKLDKSQFDCILDLGANIGLFSVLYSSIYPGKKFLAVEPEKNNYKLLKNNLKGIENMSTEQAGIWYRHKRLTIKDNGNNWGFTVEEIDDNIKNVECIKGIDIDTLCEKYNLLGNLLIKMDIEGSEIPIFNHLDNQNWLDRTYALIIEIHDKRDGEDYRNICEIMENRGYCQIYKGENVVFIRNR